MYSTTEGAAAVNTSYVYIYIVFVILNLNTEKKNNKLIPIRTFYNYTIVFVFNVLV